MVLNFFKKKSMKWHKLESEAGLNQIIEASKEKPILIFKHSTRCSISSMALNRLERSWQDNDSNKVDAYYLDLINYRDISNKIVEIFKIPHESPQALVIKSGDCVYHDSHSGINYYEILETA